MSKNLELILSISSLHSQIFKRIEGSLSLHGISFSEFIVMRQLSLVPNRTMRRIDLAEKVNMSASGVTRLLNPMEKLKIVQKEQSLRDARVSFVKLSDAGSELLNDAIKTMEQVSNDIAESLSSSEIELFLNILQKINKRT